MPCSCRPVKPITCSAARYEPSLSVTMTVGSKPCRFSRFLISLTAAALSQHPSPDRLVADLQPALRQQICSIAVAQGEAQVEPNRVPDQIGRKTVAGVGNRLHA